MKGNNQKAAQEVLALKGEVNRSISQVFERQAERLAIDDPERPTVFRREMAIVDNLKRIYTLSQANRQAPATRGASQPRGRVDSRLCQ